MCCAIMLKGFCPDGHVSGRQALCNQALHCYAFPVVLSNLCQELAIGKGSVSDSAISAVLAISAHGL